MQLLPQNPSSKSWYGHAQHASHTSTWHWWHLAWEITAVSPTNSTTSCGCGIETSTLSIACDSWDELVRHLSKKGILGKGYSPLPLSWGWNLHAHIKNELIPWGRGLLWNTEDELSRQKQEKKWWFSGGQQPAMPRERSHCIYSHWHLVLFLSESWHIAGQMISLTFLAVLYASQELFLYECNRAVKITACSRACDRTFPLHAVPTSCSTCF